MSDQSPQKKPYPLRMPDEMRAELDEYASRGGRSLNAEIVARLEQSLGGIPDEFAAMRAIRMLMDWGKAHDLKVSVEVRRKDDDLQQITTDQDALPK